MKRCLYALMVLVVLLTGCASSGKTFTSSPEELAGSILEQASFTDQLTALPEDAALRLYGLDAGDVDSCCIYVGTGSTAEEIAVFRMKDEKLVDTAKQAIEKRIQYQTDNFESYVPTEVPKLEKSVTVTGGTTVLFVVSNDADQAKSVIDSLS